MKLKLIQNFAERKPDAVRMLLVKGTFLQY